MKKIRISYVSVLLLASYIGFDYYNTIPVDPEREDQAYFAEVPNSPLTDFQTAMTSKQQSNTVATPIFAGPTALSARLQIINNAEKGIDLQYFLLTPDYAGALISEALLRAAERGVRVRFLLDDVFTTASDSQIRYLASHENVEIRYTNPLSRKVWRYANYILDPIQVNRRVHNKLIVADGSVGIVGGRNLADEYYGIDRSHAFSDFDLFITGEAVDQIGAEFDKYWNDEFSVSMTLILGPMNEDQMADAERRRGELLEAANEDIYADVVKADFLANLRSGALPIFGIDQSEAVSDRPSKLRQSTNQTKLYSVANSLSKQIENAQSEIVIYTPYFVPQDWGTKALKDAAERGVKVHVITNSLESTNHSYVHAGYFPRRKTLLQSGVQLSEVRADAPEIVSKNDNAPALTMHTKLAIFDQKTVMVTSFNFDPRSIVQNTELALFLESTELAQSINDAYGPKLDDFTYSVSLENDDLHWTYNGEPQENLTSEPAGFMRKLVARVASWLPVESQL